MNTRHDLGPASRLHPLAAAVLARSGFAAAASLTIDGTIGGLTGTIRATNTDMAPDGCPAGSGADTLNLTAPRFTKATPDVAIFGPTAYPLITRVTVIVNGDGAGAIIERSSAGGTLGRIDADGGTPDPNDGVTGPGARELPARLTALRTSLLCR